MKASLHQAISTQTTGSNLSQATFCARDGLLYVEDRRVDFQTLQEHFPAIQRALDLAAELRHRNLDPVITARLLNQRLASRNGFEPALPIGEMLEDRRFQGLARRFHILREGVRYDAPRALDGNRATPIADLLSDLAHVVAESDLALELIHFYTFPDRAPDIFRALHTRISPFVDCAHGVIGDMGNLNTLLERQAEFGGARRVLELVTASVDCDREARTPYAQLGSAYGKALRAAMRYLTRNGQKIEPQQAELFLSEFHKWASAITAVRITDQICIVKNNLEDSSISSSETTVLSRNALCETMQVCQHYAQVLLVANRDKVSLRTLFLLCPLLSARALEEAMYPPNDTTRWLRPVRLNAAARSIAAWQTRLSGQKEHALAGQDLLDFANLVDVCGQLSECAYLLQKAIDSFMRNPAIRVSLMIPGWRGMMRWASEVRFAERFCSVHGASGTGFHSAKLQVVFQDSLKLLNHLGDGKLLREGLAPKPKWLT